MSVLKIALRGCNGRMGQTVSTLCAASDTAEVVAGFDIVTERRFDYPVYSDPADFFGTCDVVIDFSKPDKIEQIFDFCIRRNVPLVLATTGLSDVVQQYVGITAKRVAVFQSWNMSMGVSLLCDLVKKAAAVLGGDCDIEIIERHHSAKTDAPSGTAKMLFNSAAEALPYTPDAVYDRSERSETRPEREIGIHTVRGGTIIGEHEVLFACNGETLSLTHTSYSRDVFASGALHAAAYIVGKPAGLYSMNDLINEK